MMKGDGFRITLLIVLLSLLPSYSNADIEKKSSIVGNLSGLNDQPISGITVLLLDSFFLAEVAKAVTDRDGKFLLPGLMPGLYLLSVDLPALSGIFKKVQVLSDAPTIVDLRSILTREQMKDHDAWDKFKWTIRVAERNPLREEKSISLIDAPASSNFLASVWNFAHDNRIQGEVSYLNVDSNMSGSDWGQRMTQFAVQGDLEGSGSWSVSGNMLDGSRRTYIGSGDIQYLLGTHEVGATVAANELLFARYSGLLRKQMIRRFVETTGRIEEENKLWIGSVDLNDQWQVLERLNLGYGTRIDYYGYMESPVSYSPRVSFSYQLTPDFSLEGVYYRNHSAPGNYYLQPDDILPFLHDVAFVPYSENLTAETTNGYEAGFQFSGEGYEVSFLYHSEIVHDKIATIDVRNSPALDELESRPFIIFNANATDLQSRGMAIEVTREINPALTAVASYRMSLAVPVHIIEKIHNSKRRLFFKEGDDLQDHHDLQAGISANISRTHTRVQADWRFSSSTPFVFGSGQENQSLSTFDLEVHQGIPVQVFAQTQLQVTLAIRNLLDQSSDTEGNADFQRALQYGMPRVVAGGLLLKF